MHLLADLNVDIEELGDTAVQADRLALVQVALAVVSGNALLGAGLGQAVRRCWLERLQRGDEDGRLERLQVESCLPGEHVGNHLDFSLGSSDLLLRGHLGLATEEKGHRDG